MIEAKELLKPVGNKINLGEEVQKFQHGNLPAGQGDQRK
jgi:hypothetical protein